MRVGTPVVMLTNSMPPYRASILRRIRRAFPQIDLITFLTHHPGEGDRWPPVAQDVLPQVFFAPHQVPGPTSVLDHLRDIKKGLRVLRHLHRLRPAALLVCGYNDATRFMTILWSFATGTPAWLVADSNIRDDNKGRRVRLLKSGFLKPLMRLMNGAMPHGTYGTQYFRRYGVPLSRIYLLPFEPDYRQIDSIRDDGANAMADRLELAAGRRRIIYSGRLVDAKRVDLLLQAFNRSAAHRPDWDVLILGMGPLESQLREMIEPQLSSRVRFVPPFRDPGSVFAVYRRCDVLVLPSDYEPWAIVVNEAAASGLALVCSDVVGAAADLLRDGVNGRTFRKGDLDDLVRALLDVTDPANLDRYKQASLDVIADWRKKADPVDGFAAAMRSVGVLPAEPHQKR